MRPVRKVSLSFVRDEIAGRVPVRGAVSRRETAAAVCWTWYEAEGLADTADEGDIPRMALHGTLRVSWRALGSRMNGTVMRHLMMRRPSEGLWGNGRSPSCTGVRHRCHWSRRRPVRHHGREPSVMSRAARVPVVGLRLLAGVGMVLRASGAYAPGEYP